MGEEKDKSRKARDISGLFVPAGLFIGMGVGWGLGHMVPGLLAGLGVGFLLMAVAQMIYARK